jgi:hypothetical protein
MPRNREHRAKPIESFGAELLAALVEGAKRKVEVRLPYKKAVHLTQRINMLRREMQQQGHPQYSVASQARLSVSWPPDTDVRKTSRGVSIPVNRMTMCTVTIQPADSQFGDALRAAGVVVPTLKHDPTEDIKPSAPRSIEDDILASYVTSGGVKP